MTTHSPAEQPDFDDASRRRLEQAVDVARNALVEVKPDGIGEHVHAESEAPFTVTHRFVAELSGYRGWHWACVVALAPGSTEVTVDEIALLPGEEALVAPRWVPWDERIRPGDLGAGDLLPSSEDDDRLVPGQMLSGDDELDAVAGPVGLGRRQHLSPEGRSDAAERWYSERGPDSDIARSAEYSCGTCGFLVPLAGSLGTMFGVCANRYSADGQVVSHRYGCGAHSEVSGSNVVAQRAVEAYDDAAVDLVVLPQQLEGARRAAESSDDTGPDGDEGDDGDDGDDDTGADRETGGSGTD